MVLHHTMFDYLPLVNSPILSMSSLPPIEHHPLRPFLPPNARLLMLGSFPPPIRRWSMNFFYPNLQNDMWRIFGHLYFNRTDYFIDPQTHCFNQPLLESFLQDKGIALYDTASAVRRLKENASDKYLEIAIPTDIVELLSQIPDCKAIATTGQKATEAACQQFQVDQPPIGSSVAFSLPTRRRLLLYRMPSSSRAYPLSLEKKAAHYATMLRELQML